MLDFLRFWRYYRYPAHHWAADISQILTQTSMGDAAIIDAPCGDGIISYWLIKRGIRHRYELYDISERTIGVARRMADWKKTRQLELHIEPLDIHQVPLGHGTEDIWLLINSLYLLPEIDQLLSRMRSRADDHRRVPLRHQCQLPTIRGGDSRYEYQRNGAGRDNPVLRQASIPAAAETRVLLRAHLLFQVKVPAFGDGLSGEPH